MHPNTATSPSTDTRNTCRLSLYRLFRLFAGPAVAFRLAFVGGAA